MAEHSFQEVMRQYKRMCCGKACSDCDFYKFKMSLTHQMACLRFLKEYPVEAEALVMNWAAEHPEQVYPTWGEYLISKGLLMRNWNKNGTPPYDMYIYAKRALANRISEEDAAKLGIDPKYGV